MITSRFNFNVKRNNKKEHLYASCNNLDTIVNELKQRWYTDWEVPIE